MRELNLYKIIMQNCFAQSDALVKQGAKMDLEALVREQGYPISFKTQEPDKFKDFLQQKIQDLILVKIKARIHELDHWRDKEETQSMVNILIRDLLWEELPESYGDEEIAIYRQTLYEYVYNTYPAA